jgi:hypothetical protein
MMMAREPRSHLTLVTRTILMRRNRQCGCVRQSGWTPPLELSKLQAVIVKQAKAAADDRQKLARAVRRSQEQAAKGIFDEKAGRIKKRHPLVVAQKASEKKKAHVPPAGQAGHVPPAGRGGCCRTGGG